MAIETVDLDLSMVNPDTGRYLVAHTYTVDGITEPDGSLRMLSIGQLVMALCLDRATKLERNIIEMMNDMNATSSRLEIMTEIEQAVVDWAASQSESASYKLDDHTTSPSGPYGAVDYLTFLQDTRYGVNLGLGVDVTSIRVNASSASSTEVLYDDFISRLESKMDEQNSFGQQKMIELQSLTSKRDQAYDMISNILKSLNTVLVGNANNM